MGYALDLTVCAVTGATEGLCYVSPKSGRAVSLKGAGEWADKLLPLPDVLRGEGEGTDAEIGHGFVTTGYFLERHLAQNLGGKPLPEARARFVEAFNRQR
jgi:DNA repair protein RecO (recombination protein O)